MKLRTEAPVNGGRNYNGPKVNQFASLSKTEPYAGNSSHSRSVLAVEYDGSQNLTDKGTIRREGSETWRTLRDFTFGHILENWKHNGWWDLLTVKVVSSSESILTLR